MKLSEFQEKLTTVSDSKLRLMLADSRRKGPEVAVKLILAEAERRGTDLNALPEPAVRSGAESGPAAGFPSGDAGNLGSMGGTGDTGGTGDEAGAGAAMQDAAPQEAVPQDGEPAAKGAWLAEEADKGGMPVFVKVMLAAAVVGGILFGLVLLLGKP